MRRTKGSRHFQETSRCLAHAVQVEGSLIWRRTEAHPAARRSVRSQARPCCRPRDCRPVFRRVVLLGTLRCGLRQATTRRHRGDSTAILRQEPRLLVNLEAHQAAHQAAHRPRGATRGTTSVHRVPKAGDAVRRTLSFQAASRLAARQWAVRQWAFQAARLPQEARAAVQRLVAQASNPARQGAEVEAATARTATAIAVQGRGAAGARRKCGEKSFDLLDGHVLVVLSLPTPRLA